LKPSIAIIGGGASALFLAATIDTNQYSVTIYEKNKALGRKFLVAGDGGFNLTHGSPIEEMKKQYHPQGFLDNCLDAFTNTDLRQWLKQIGIATFEGSSHRIYPNKGIKPIQVLQNIIQLLQKKGVQILCNQNWKVWAENGSLIFDNLLEVKADKVVFALGGGSWKVTGSDGAWLPYFKEKGIKVSPFQASNCAFQIPWQEDFIQLYNGHPIKNCALRFGDTMAKGELVITKFGIEGNAIYALSREIQNELNSHQKAIVYLDLKPMFSQEQIKEKLNQVRFKNISEALKSGLHLNAMQIQLIKQNISKEDYINIESLAFHIKNLALEVLSSAAIDEAISTTGGIAIEEVDEDFQLKTLPNHYVIGEMLDWDAPTGGYLLQACFSMGVALGKKLNGVHN
jgi:uncharacterized flavoprotein (TIGR03862 family)